MVGLAPRALRNCAPSAPWAGASVRPLNFTVRRLMQPQRVVTLVICALGAAACGFTFEVPQNVVVHLSRAGAVVPGVTLRYYSQPGCTGSYVEAVTDLNGTANFSRIVHRGRYAVVLEKPSLCTEPGETWSQLWTTTHDPPDKLRLECDLSAAPREVCSRVDRDGV